MCPFDSCMCPVPRQTGRGGEVLKPDLHLADLHCPLGLASGDPRHPHDYMSSFFMNANLYTFLKEGVSERVLWLSKIYGIRINCKC